MRQGDIIERFQDDPVKDVGNFRNRVALTAPGSKIELTILRDGKRKTVEVTIGKLAKGQHLTEAASERAEDIGLTVQTLTPQLAEQFDATVGEGVIVTEVRPGSVAAMAGIRQGTIILQVDRKQVNSVDAFQQALKESIGNKRLLLLVREGGIQRFVVLNW